MFQREVSDPTGVRIVARLVVATVLVATLLATLGGARADAFSRTYCDVFLQPWPHYCGHGSYNSIIYNRSQASTYGNNNCVFMITAAGNIRGGNGGVIVCDNNQDGQARECLTSPTPMSQGITYTVSATDYVDAVVNNTTYDSGCAV